MAKKEIEEIKVSNDPLYLAIEEKRTAFAKQFNKQKIINGCVLGATLLAIILTYVFLLEKVVIALIIMVSAIVTAIVFSTFVKKKMDRFTNEYIEYFYSTQTKYVFNNNVNYIDVVSHPFEKLKPEEFVNAGFVLNVSHIGSRNTLYGQVSGLYFKAVDCVAKVTTNRITETAFLGKYFMIELDKEVNGKTLIYMGPQAQEGAGPNDLDGLDQVIVPGQPSDVVVWSSNKQFKKILTPGVIKAIKAFEPNTYLEDICFSIKSNALYVAVSYTNDMMVLPLLNGYQIEPTYQYKEDTEKLAVLVKELRKAINNKAEKDAEELLEDKVETSVETPVVEEVPAEEVKPAKKKTTRKKVEKVEE